MTQLRLHGLLIDTGEERAEDHTRRCSSGKGVRAGTPGAKAQSSPHSRGVRTSSTKSRGKVWAPSPCSSPAPHGTGVTQLSKKAAGKLQGCLIQRRGSLRLGKPRAGDEQPWGQGQRCDGGAQEDQANEMEVRGCNSFKQDDITCCFKGRRGAWGSRAQECPGWRWSCHAKDKGCQHCGAGVGTAMAERPRTLACPHLQPNSPREMLREM